MSGITARPIVPSVGADTAALEADIAAIEADIAALGGAALLDVGTGSGTVAAGNDSRFGTWTGGSTNLVVVTARSSLGLGGAALLAVGTTAGTVAAGDDSRFNQWSGTATGLNAATGRSSLSVPSLADLAGTGGAASIGTAAGITVEAALAAEGMTGPTASDQTSSDNTTGAATALTVSVTAGRTYAISWLMNISVTSSLTNGFRINIVQSGGATGTGSVYWLYPTASATDSSGVNGPDIWTSNGTGPAQTGGAAGSVVLGTAHQTYKCTVSGTLTLWIRPETNSSQITCHSGSVVSWNSKTH